MIELTEGLMLHAYLHTCFDLWCEMAPWLLIGFVLAFLCSLGLSERAIRRHLGGPGWTPILKASVFGLPLPICSCGVLLVGLALRKNGARKAPVCAFLASTPQAGTDALLVSIPLLGPLFTFLRLLGAVLAGLVTGAFVRWWGIAQPPPHEKEDLPMDGCAAICACHHHDKHHPHHEGEAHHHEFADWSTRLRDAATYAFIHLPGEIALLLAIGIFIAAGLTTFLPEHLFADLPLVAAYALAIFVAIPTYACSLAILPIAVGLLDGGLSSGAVFIFMACAPTTHLSALLILGKTLGWRTLLCFLLGITTVALALGLAIDVTHMLTLSDFPATEAHHHHHTLSMLSLIPVALLLLHGFSRRAIVRLKHHV